MVEVSSFSQAWEAYVKEHGQPPKDANQLQKYSKLSKEIDEIAYPVAKLQWSYNSKIANSADVGVDPQSDDIASELERLQQQLGNKYKAILERGFFEFGKTFSDKSRIKVMQYNVTLDKLSSQAKQSDEKSDEKEIAAEQWQYRGYRIIEEIKHHDPDIVTVQELNHFKFMSHYLKPLGYDGVFKLNANSKLLEGVAIFYKSASFELNTTFVYGKDVEPKLKFDLFALSLVLTHKHSDKSMLVCSANLDAKDKTAMRLQKLMHLMASLRSISTANNDAAIFVGCDLGGDQTGSEYMAIQHGTAFLQHHENEAPKDYEAGFGLGLESAYFPAFYAGKTKSLEPASTAFKTKCRDFIFYDPKKGVNVSNVLELPLEKTISEYKKYPNYRSPSVHFPLMALFFV